MKKLRSLYFLVCFCMMATLASSAQNTWIGGFPGRENDWNFARNWSLQQVPDEWDQVLIPNTSTTTMSYPVITTDAGTVASIILGYNAYITITETGSIGIENEDQSNVTIPEKLLAGNQIVIAANVKCGAKKDTALLGR